MATWRFQQLKTGQWGARGYFPRGESAPLDEEILGQIVEVAKKDGTSQTKRITGIEGWFRDPQGWASVSCEIEDAEPDDNGAKPNLPSAPRVRAAVSARNPHTALYSRRRVSHLYEKRLVATNT